MDPSNEPVEASAASVVDSGVTLDEERKTIIYEPYPANVPGKNRGMAIIFNQETFRFRVKTREGTVEDCDRLSSILKNFGFQVDVHLNYRTAQIRKELLTVASMDHTDNECLLICVMTHGMPGRLEASDGYYYDVHELWSHFTETECPSLKGKPKILLIQACRGDKIDEGVGLQFQRSFSEQPHSEATVNDGVPIFTPESFNDFITTLLEHLPANAYQQLSESHPEFRFFQSLQQMPQSHQSAQSQSQEPSLSQQSSESDSIPFLRTEDRLDEVDFFVVYATVYGYYSYRLGKQGSWFIQELCNILEKCGRKFSLSTLMTFVNQRVAIRYLPNRTSDGKIYKKKTQTLCIVNTLTRPFYFYPEESEDVPDSLEDILENI